MSIIRVGLAETKGFSDGYDAIFGKKKKSDAKAASNKKTEENSGKKKKSGKK